ncbi:FGGY-family carbohydrate kinase [Anaerobium acetethylicum]|uniref:Xylulokinase n=1 Tax=Anaerobium acetethylicum TaxID=1619234 RepID=A0A1D3TW43_9FIRM|nr:FGGY family carbohydrate kinase [Anaerobium acetethylicum]SCP98404.1 xylulokinase [Anaerobium acetethylicum]
MNNKKAKYALGIDAGTTGCRTLIFDLKGNTVGEAYEANPLKFPKPGWLELNPQYIIENCYASTKRAIKESGVDPEEIGSVSFTFMRSSFVLRKHDGSFVRDIVMWQDLRCQEMFPWMKDQIAKNGMTEDEFYELSGFPLCATTWPSAKIYWVKKNEPELYEAADVIHSIHALVMNAYGADGFIDDKEDIGWWGIINGTTFEYEKKLADMFEVDIDKYAKNERSGKVVGEVTKEVAKKTGLAIGTPLVVGCGDHQCAAIGLGNNHEGMVSLAMGTCGLLVAHSHVPPRDPNSSCQVLGTPMDGEWEIEAHSNAAASSFRWLRDAIMQTEMEVQKQTGIDVYDLMTAQAAKAKPGCDGLIYLPWNAGANCPHYDPSARGAFIGFTFAHGKPEIIRSVMEGVLYDIKDMYFNLLQAGLPEFKVMRLTGGAARSDLWCQMTADVLGIAVETVESEEATALGAAMIGATGAGIFDSLQDAIDNMVHVKKRFEPNPENVEIYKKLYEIFTDSYNALKTDVFPKISKYQGY